MQKISFILIFFCSVFVYSNTITGHLKKCEPDQQNYDTHYLKLWQSGKLIREKIESGYLGEFNIKDIPPGDYILEFENTFGQKIKKKIELKKDIQNIELCLDDFVDTNVSTTFGTLKDKEVLTLKYSTVGCFHHYEEELKFYRNGVKYFGVIIKTSGRKEIVPLSIAKVNYLIEFERKFRILAKQDGFCTTSNSYDFVVDGKSKFRGFENSCKWDGFSLMKDYIFGE